MNITCNLLKLAIQFLALLLLLFHIGDESLRVYLGKSLLDLDDGFGEVLIPAFLDLVNLDLKRLLLCCLLLDLSLEHLVSLLELCALEGLLDLSLDRRSNLQRLHSNLVLFDQARVLAELLQGDRHGFAHREHLLLHRVDPGQPLRRYFLLSLQHALQRVLKFSQRPVLLLSLSLELVVFFHDDAELLFERRRLLLEILAVLADALLVLAVALFGLLAQLEDLVEELLQLGDIIGIDLVAI